ncbi:Metallothionein expression activator [Xylographa bjoerkii]|nr:Metallothionein expression activator [Xylographa bjoerkii]
MARPGQHTIQIPHNLTDKEHCRSLTTSPVMTPSLDQSSFGTSSYTAYPAQFVIQQQPQYQQRNNTVASEEQVPFIRHLEGFDDGINNYIRDLESNESNTSFCSGNMSESQSIVSISKDIPRPFTPPSQSSTNYFPLTPATTPFTKDIGAHKNSTSRTAQSSPVRRGPTGTIKAPRAQSMKRGSSHQDIFDTKYSINAQRLASPPHTVQLPCSSTFDIAPIPSPSFMSMSALKMEFSRSDTGYDSSYYSPKSHRVSPTLSSFQSSPELAHLDLFPELNDKDQGPSKLEPMSHLSSLHNTEDPSNFSFDVNEEPSSRTQSMSDPSAQSIDGTMVDTGITSEEIASFIQGPDAQSKYACMFPGCTKKFGRKENVRAHVQTHLGDRQYVCNHCYKPFVRQHDLKRHVRIHSGEKGHPCPCGTEFGREDALTRHRQRGMCSGAFPGTPKRECKRGRPRKNNRPDTPERREKAARTRQRVLEKKAYASSLSGSSEYSLPSPPQMFEDMDMRDTSPFDTLPEMQPISYGISPDIFSYTPPDSPGYSTGNCFSPQQSQLSHTPKAGAGSPSPKRSRSITSIVEEVLDELPPPVSPAKSTFSQHGTPPELELSSSSPIATRFFAFDQASEIGDFSTQTSNLPTGQDEEDFDMSKLQQYQTTFEDAFKSDSIGSPLSEDLFQSTWGLDEFIAGKSTWEDDFTFGDIA